LLARFGGERGAGHCNSRSNIVRDTAIAELLNHPLHLTRGEIKVEAHRGV